MYTPFTSMLQSYVYATSTGVLKVISVHHFCWWYVYTPFSGVLNVACVQPFYRYANIKVDHPFYWCAKSDVCIPLLLVWWRWYVYISFTRVLKVVCVHPFYWCAKVIFVHHLYCVLMVICVHPFSRCDTGDICIQFYWCT
jgi:hypothetical protein